MSIFSFRHKMKKYISKKIVQSEYIEFIRCSSYEEAKMKADLGYESQNILEKCKSAMLLVKNGQAVYERDSVVFDEIQHNFPLVATLLKISLKNNNTLNIVDFGGSLGSTYYQCKPFLEDLKTVNWSIVEQKKFVDCGIENFQDDYLKFYCNINDAKNSVKSQMQWAILLSSTLPYLDNPYRYMEEIISYKFEYIIIDRTYFLNGNEDYITLQNVPECIYKASYPAWFFSESKLKNFLDENGYSMLYEWDSFVRIDVRNVPFKEKCSDKGILFKRKN